MIYPIHTPNIVQSFFPKFLWRLPKVGQKTIYLTFDDGPIPLVTPWVIDQLSQYNAQATFFCVGANIEKYPSIFQRTKAAGHAIGNHTYNHLNGWKTNLKNYLANVKACQNLTQSTLFRPPYGRLTPRQANYLQKEYRLVMWDVLAGDFDTSIDGNQCIENITQHTQDGSIIVLHDSQKSWPRLQVILPYILDYYTKLGFVFEAIDESEVGTEDLR